MPAVGDAVAEGYDGGGFGSGGGWGFYFYAFEEEPGLAGGGVFEGWGGDLVEGGDVVGL